MAPLAAGLDYLDLQFLGYPNIIATAVLHGPRGIALLDPGPHTTFARLTSELARRGIGIRDLTEVVLTHIHLDHAGVTGHLVREQPRLAVLVHEVGAPHMIDPSKLLASAAKLYGDDMQRLWGDVLGIPAANVKALRGGETVEAGGRALRVAYTPGHARHHVSYFDEASGIAFVGDTAGVRRPPGTYVLPATPPPDVDLVAWPESASRILSWRPSTLFVTHFGPFDDPQVHLDELMERMRNWVGKARALINRQDLTDDERRDAFVDEVKRDLRRAMGEADAELHHRAGRIDYSWYGLARALRKS
jgi:glyoxylase-like metal-dependent hydrolase (beta-lactamase superfamily II)